MAYTRIPLVVGFGANEHNESMIHFRVEGWDMSDMSVKAETVQWSDEDAIEKEVVIHVNSDDMARGIRVVTPDGSTWRLDLSRM